MQSAEPSPSRIVTASWTALYQQRHALEVTPIRISLGIPKFWHAAEAFPAPTVLMPSGWMFDLESAAFDVAYLTKLDRIGVDRIRARLATIPSAGNLALACFEADPAHCHRGLLAAWWFKQTGEVVPEIFQQLTASDAIQELPQDRPQRG